jgi:predicted DNA-binding transcriptional regulator AlpA
MSLSIAMNRPDVQGIHGHPLLDGLGAVCTTAELAPRLGLTAQHLRSMRSQGKGPPAHRTAGRRVCYATAEVARWLSDRARHG